MPTPISSALRRWLLEKGFEGYIQVTEVLAHPDTQEIAKKHNVDTVMNVNFRKKLGLTTTGEKHFETPMQKPWRNISESIQPPPGHIGQRISQTHFFGR